MQSAISRKVWSGAAQQRRERKVPMSDMVTLCAAAMGDAEVGRISCRWCKFWSPSQKRCQCPVFDYRYFTPFINVFTSCRTGEWQCPCSRFEPDPMWKATYEAWQKMTDERKHVEIRSYRPSDGLVPVLLAKPRSEGREVQDDRYYVPYENFYSGEIVQDGRIPYERYSHIEISRSSPVGYKWVHEGPGVLDLSDMTPAEPKN